MDLNKISVYRDLFICLFVFSCIILSFTPFYASSNGFIVSYEENTENLRLKLDNPKILELSLKNKFDKDMKIKISDNSTHIMDVEHPKEVSLNSKEVRKIEIKLIPLERGQFNFFLFFNAYVYEDCCGWVIAEEENGYFGGNVRTEVDDNKPVANAGGPYSVTSGENLRLNGEKSFDSDGRIEKYSWKIENIEGRDEVSILDPNSTQPLLVTREFENDVELDIYLEVFDGQGFSDTDSTTVSILKKSSGERLEEDNVVVFLFWGEGCPHCKDAMSFLEEVEQEYPRVEVKMSEVLNNSENADFFQRMAEAYGVKIHAVPTTIIGDEVWISFSDSIRKDMERKIKDCLTEDCIDPREKLESQVSKDNKVQEKFDIPVIGEVEADAYPLFVLTFLISFVDGLNPCSLWVLTFLLGIVIYAGKKKVAIVGLTFLSVTATVYGLFIAGALSIFHYVSHFAWIRFIVAMIALVFAAVSIKDFFWYKKGISFSIPERYKPGIFSRVRDIMKKESYLPTIAATAVMSAGVALVELPCTAGLPMVWSSIVAERAIETASYLALLVMYLMVYLSIELVIYFSSVLGMKKIDFGKKKGRIMKLIGGSFMSMLGLVLLIDYTLMESIEKMLIAFAVTISLTLIVVVVWTILGKFEGN